jgi:xanthine dehydrogenase accessory factor
MKSSDLLELSRELTRQNQAHAWITVISVTSPSSSYVGAQAIVRSDGELSGWIGGGCVQSAAKAAALRAIASAIPQRLRLSNSKDPSEAIDVRPMACASNGEVELFIQPAAVAPRLRIYGSTPIVRIAAWLAREADFDPLTDQEAADMDALANSSASILEATTASPLTSGPSSASKPASPLATAASTSSPPAMDRETYALIATQGEGDELALEAALRSCARAVLVIASKRKAERLRTAMKLRGISEDRIDVIHAPAGPDIGAVTPNEIALAAVAGLVALRRGHVPSSVQHTRLAYTQQTPAAHKQHTRPTSTQHKRPAPTTAENQPVTGYVNPVCGAVVDPARALSSLTLSGQTHYFCCQGCRTEFERDPKKYLEIGAHMREPARTTHE